MIRKSQPTCLSADEATPHGAVSYTGSRDHSDNWVLGDQVFCPLDEEYYSLNEGVNSWHLGCSFLTFLGWKR